MRNDLPAERQRSRTKPVSLVTHTLLAGLLASLLAVPGDGQRQKDTADRGLAFCTATYVYRTAAGHSNYEVVWNKFVGRATGEAAEGAALREFEEWYARASTKNRYPERYGAHISGPKCRRVEGEGHYVVVKLRQRARQWPFETWEEMSLGIGESTEDAEMDADDWLIGESLQGGMGILVYGTYGWD